MDFYRVKKGIMRRLVEMKRIAFWWYLKTKGRCLFSRKIKVGFGPITTGEDDLAERKWRIDPIIDGINQIKGKYVAGFFISPRGMRQYDVIIIVKKINPGFMAEIDVLKEKRFIYDIVDNPNDEEKYRYYFRSCSAFLKRMDGFILSSPVYTPWIKKIGKPALLIEHPILNPPHKRVERNDGEIWILAQGYFENLQNLCWLEPILVRLSKEVGKPIRLYYHSETVRPDSEFVRYVKWSVKNCFTMMQQVDIAITIKDLFKPHQYTKPSTKVIAYMAAGLPVICKPTASDRLVIQERITGFFAYREEDWIRWLRLLVSHAAVRRQVGKAAKNSVLQRYSINLILEKYLDLLDSLR